MAKRVTKKTSSKASRKKPGKKKAIESYRRTVSLAFEPGEHRRVAVKIIDDRGIESLKIVETD